MNPSTRSPRQEDFVALAAVHKVALKIDIFLEVPLLGK
jgi:hypothetical protein